MYNKIIYQAPWLENVKTRLDKNVSVLCLNKSKHEKSELF